MTIIGRGERTAFRILTKLYPKHEFLPQLHLYKFIDIDMKSRLAKATIDIVCSVGGKGLNLTQWRKTPKVFFHIDDRHHRGAKTAKLDFLIDYYVHEAGYETVRIREDNCPRLFSDSNDVNDPKIIEEIKNEISAWKVTTL